jgi:UDP-GlcNAc:undecaprenyl-phosphate GlcNAc-1-phosphate transferase
LTAQALAAAIVPALIAWAAIAALRGSRWARRLADHPNARSLHAVPTPRLGGIGVIAGVLPAGLLWAEGGVAAALACALALGALSVLDDAGGLPIEVRLPAHAVAALVVLLAIGAPAAALPGGWAGIALAVLALVWMTNLFNFMDGSDGLAGSMAAIGFATLAAGALAAGNAPLALVCLAIASASLGFLAHNFPPARVFLGDAGAIPLGFLAGALGLHGTLAGAWPAWFAPLAFSPFIVDATLTLLRRLARGERVWIAHRSHAYQRLVLAGWSQRRLALAACALMLAAGGSALAARGASAMLQCGMISVWAATYGLLAIVVELRTRNRAEPAQ